MSSSANKLKQIHIGKVLVDEDPKKLFRLKCFVKGIYEPEEPKNSEEEPKYENVPWVYPSDFITKMEKKYPSRLDPIPRKDTFVSIYFPDEENPYFGIYEPIDQLEKSDELKEIVEGEYPNLYGFIDHNLNYFLINREKKFIYLVSATGTFSKIMENGDLIEEIIKDYETTVKENRKITIEGDSEKIIEGDSEETIKGEETKTVEKDKVLEVKKKLGIKAENIEREATNSTKEKAKTYEIDSPVFNVTSPINGATFDKYPSGDIVCKERGVIATVYKGLITSIK